MAGFDDQQQDMALAPGQYIRLSNQPDWGIGQIQSVIGTRLTANFEEAGKQVVNSAAVTIESVTLED